MWEVKETWKVEHERNLVFFLFATLERCPNRTSFGGDGCGEESF